MFLFKDTVEFLSSVTIESLVETLIKLKMKYTYTNSKNISKNLLMIKYTSLSKNLVTIILEFPEIIITKPDK